MRKLLLAALALTIAIAVACVADPAPPAAVVATKAAADLPPWEGHRALPMLPHGVTPPQPYLAAVALWHTATSAYALGDSGASADAFLAVAAKLHGGEPEPIARTFTAGRCLAYENAARVYAAVGQRAEAQAKLTSLAAADPGCKSSIANAFEGLE